MIPLILKLKKAEHKEVAKAQDLIVETLYKTFEYGVIHGGTSIWRCYHGSRFSEDVDVYISRDLKKIDLFFSSTEKLGFIIKKKKIGENSLYSNLELNETSVRLEAIFKKVNGSLAEYEAVDGNLITVYTLLPEELINEKVNAYLGRKKIRDLYDIFYLLRFVKDKKLIIKSLKKLIDEFPRPVDEKDLKILIIEGIVPNLDSMLLYIKRSLN